MVRISLSISEEVLKELDFYRYHMKENRSSFMVKALKNYFKIVEQQVMDKRRKKAIEDIKDSRKRLADKLCGWDPTKDLRKLRESRYSKSMIYSCLNWKIQVLL